MTGTEGLKWGDGLLAKAKGGTRMCSACMSTRQGAAGMHALHHEGCKYYAKRALIERMLYQSAACPCRVYAGKSDLHELNNFWLRY